MALVSRVFLSFLLTLFPVSFAYFTSTYYPLSIQIPLLILIHAFLSNPIFILVLVCALPPPNSAYVHISLG